MVTWLPIFKVLHDSGTYVFVDSDVNSSRCQYFSIVKS